MKPIEPGCLAIVVYNQPPCFVWGQVVQVIDYWQEGDSRWPDEAPWFTVDLQPTLAGFRGVGMPASDLRRIDDDPDAETTPADERQEVEA